MSTIKTTYLQHPSAGSPSLTLASSGAVEINGSMTGAGLDHITTESFTNSASFSIDNIFNDTYDIYKMTMVVENSAPADVRFRYRSNGSTNTSLNYEFVVFYAAANAQSGISSNGSGQDHNNLF